jgi:hypothetical protein
MAVDNKSHAIMGGVLVGIGYFLQGRKGFNAEKKSLARNTIKAKGRNSYDRFKHNMEMKVKMLSPHFKKKYAKENRLPSLTSGGTTRYWQAYVDGWREMENAKVKDMGDVIGLGFKPENAFSVNEYWGRIDGADAYMDWRRGKKDTSGYYSKAYFIPTEEYDVMNAESFNADHCQECGRKEGPYSDTKLVACQGCHELACQHCLKGDKSSCKFCFKGVSAETFNAVWSRSGRDYEDWEWQEGDEGKFVGGDKFRIIAVENLSHLGKANVYIYTQLDEEGNEDGFVYTADERRFPKKKNAETFNAESGEPIYVVKRDYTGVETDYLIGTESYILKEMGVVIDVNAHELDIDYEDMSLEEIFDTVFEYSDEYGPDLVGKFTDGMYLRLKSYDGDKDVGVLEMFDGETLDYTFDLSRLGFKHESNAETFGADYVDIENTTFDIDCVIDGQEAILTNVDEWDEEGGLWFYFPDEEFIFGDDELEREGDTWSEKRKRLTKDINRVLEKHNIPPHKAEGVDEMGIYLRKVNAELGVDTIEWDEEKGDLMLTLELNDGVDKQYAYISTPLKRDDFVNHNNAETLSKSHHDPHSLEYNPTGICKTYTCRTEIGGMYEDSDAMRFKRFLEEYPKQFGIKNVRLKPQPEANIPLGAVYITFEICDDSEWSLVTDETGELYGHTEWGIKELKQRLDYDLNVAMRNDLDKYADLHRPIQTLAEGDEPNENWYMEAETFSAEAEGGMLYSKNEMPAGKRHYVWSLDSDEAGRYQVRIVGSDMTPAIPMKYFERAWEGTATNKRNPSMSFDEPKKGEYHPHILDFRYPKYMRKSNDPLKQGLKHQISIDANEWDWERFSRENPKLLRKLYNKDGQFFYIFDNFDPSNYRYQNRRNRYRGA